MKSLNFSLANEIANRINRMEISQVQLEIKIIY